MVYPGVLTVHLNCANIPNLLSEVWFDPGDRVGSNGTPEGWLIFEGGLNK